MEALGTLIGVLENLKTISLRPSLSQKNIMVYGPSKAKVNWDGFGLPLLQRFEWPLCSCTFFRVPKWIGELSNLRILKIAISELFREDVNILKRLHSLAALSLYVHATQVERIIFDKAGFSVLKYLKIWCSLPCLQFETEAMPKLQKLKLGFNAHKAGIHGSIPICIDHLPGLNHISATIGGRITGAEAALRAAISNHPSNTRINVKLVDWTFYSDEDMSMTSKEKQGDEILDNLLDKYQFTREDGSLVDQNKQILSMVTEEQEHRTPEKQNEFLEMSPYEFAVTEDKNKEATIRTSTPSPCSSITGGREGGDWVHYTMNNNKKLKLNTNLSSRGTLSQTSDDGNMDHIVPGSGLSDENITTNEKVCSSGGFSIGSLDSSNNIMPFMLRRKQVILNKVISKNRTVADRQRRIRISNSLKNLQALVPNMEKKTNTADMLDSLIEYIKEMESHLQILKKQDENCTCQCHGKSSIKESSS